MREFENGCPCCGGTLWHLDGCPNDKSGAKIPVPARLTCDECGRYIPEDIEVYVQEIGGRKYYYCRDCLRKMTLGELLELFNIDLPTAGYLARKAEIRI